MPNTISTRTVSTSSIVTTKNNSVLFASGEILSELGFKDQRPAIHKADRVYQFAKQKLLFAIKTYEKIPSLTQRKNLVKVLKREITRITSEYKLAKNKQIYYEKEIEMFAKTSPNQNYASRFGNWVLGNVKQFFGSDNENLAKHYADIAKNREIQLEELKKYHSYLTQKQPVKQKNKSLKQKIVEVTTLKKLSADVAPIPSQFPASYSLSNLNGQTGVKFIGENAGDQSGMSVSNAGDVNGDKLDDLIIAAPNANSGVGACYIVFGRSSNWSSPISLSSLNGSNGAKFLGAGTIYQGAGNPVSGLGDVNGDGIGDFIVGAYNANAAYLVFGQTGRWITPYSLSNLNGTNGAIFSGGWSVGGAGDVNGDGINDFLIGEPASDCAFLVFGHMGTWATPFNLATNLDGTNGVTIIGESSFDDTGISVSGFGDLNGDKISDFIVGDNDGNSQVGVSYVVFGHTGAWTSPFYLSNLNGVNGAKFLGNRNDNSGISVSNVGDINNDALSDFIIGAPMASSFAGAGYAVFGHNGTWVTPFSLSDLNGVNGAKFLGEAAFYDSGTSVNGIGDMNGDGIGDFIIGAPANIGYLYGQSYVMFGYSGSWITPFSLSNLNGANGVKFLGENNNDWSGYSVSGAGDVNGDGINDFIVGAPNFNGIGASYVVFGDRQGRLLNNAPFILSEGKSVPFNSNYLNAVYNNIISARVQFLITNIQHSHFELVTEPGRIITDFTQQQITNEQVLFVHDGSCAPPSYQLAANDGGISFIPVLSNITFVPISPIITRNNLLVNQNPPVILSAYSLNVTDPGDNFANLQFTVSDVKHGNFSFISNPSKPITQFTQAQINSGAVQFASDGSTTAPRYSLSVQDSCGWKSPIQTASISFNLSPVFGNNRLTVNQGQTVILTLDDLSATDPDDLASTLQFSVNNVTHGQFSAVTNPTTAISYFSQSEIISGGIQFTQDGSNQKPSYSVQVSDPKGAINLGNFQVATITFDAYPIIEINQLSILQGQSVLFSTADLSATSVTSSAPLTFSISNVSYGYFESTINPGIEITLFTQQDIANSHVQFVQDGTRNKPSYMVSTSDGVLTSNPQLAAISFRNQPLLLKNRLVLKQGQTVIVSNNNIQATDDYFSVTNLQFAITNIQNGQFEYASNPGVAITDFKQADINGDTIRFVARNIKPSYEIAVSNDVLSTIPISAIITFYTYPILQNNQLAINQGETIVLTPSNLNATNSDVLDANLVFAATSVQNGHFEFVQYFGTVITNFYQNNISNRAVQFFHDGTLQAPSYFISVSNGILTTPAQASAITFNPILPTNTNPDNTVRNAIIGAAISGAIGFGFLAIRFYLDRKGKQYLEQISDEKDGIGKQQADYIKNVIRPFVKHIFGRVQMTGFCGYISEQTMKDAFAAVVTLVNSMRVKGVEVDLTKLDALAQTNLLQIVGRETRRTLVPNSSCCSSTYCVSFFKPEVTPDQIEAKAEIIAQKVKSALDNQRLQSPETSVKVELLDEKDDMKARLLTSSAANRI